MEQQAPKTADASVFDISCVKNNTSRLLCVLASNRSVHFYPAFKIIFSLPVSLYRRDLLQHDQFLALKVSRNHSQNTLNSATRNNYELAMFSRVLLHPTSAACVCKSALNCVLSTSLKKFLRKVKFLAPKSLVKAFVVLGRNHSQTVLLKFSNGYGSLSPYEESSFSRPLIHRLCL